MTQKRAIEKGEISLVIVAAGSSERFCAHLPPHQRVKKQWLRIGNVPLWKKVADDFMQLYDFAQTIIAVSPDDYSYIQKAYGYPVVIGGNTRQASVQNALQHIHTPFVLISDAARWCLDGDVIANLLNQANTHTDCIAPYLEVADTAVYGGTYIDRKALKLIQTPQLCHTQKLKDALTKGTFTDESSAISHCGGKVSYITGSPKLAKLTHGDDLHRLKDLPCVSGEIFTGSGFDVHGFEVGKKMVLGGVEMDTDFGFKAHSDGDVALHALTDALLGAIGGGDIGEWFPDTDKTYQNANSKLLLKKVYDFAISIGFEIINADITIFAQTPKIAPYKSQIRQSIASLLHTDLNRINIKATTTEHLGFIGRKEGICTQANVHLRFIDWRAKI
ncbi:hypothetical protein BKH46_06100 [Helicobacter sp. 12S02634-8]|uniref:bifunctional 2-C-methyl-D-erythritol 4-phosphate cytidylyltransferase/2-C-methyl-D-erythritol 2,4-cyclodiphosphate synthase n=1 Tax=Helicobacter sp. 12S02634-8 TaxID=1476199 RepID=UPI000BA706F6|nr:bifunctional 2-C-methyl-D-erythritol 4-phosphate cytidylyltransferase/2-C-methyl-D-erythritol 2,4-cyclodiphosphate synthase [Helicobacter sp. 12S02634-8]PAF46789.1 hypothetical protein BKH46_06100 [Helicobacter sp. 12S02634-8]